LRWMFQPESPLQVGFPSSMDLLRWEWLFLRSANNKRAKKGQEPVRDLSLLSSMLYRDLDAHLKTGIRHNGILMLSATEESVEEEHLLAARAGELGLETSLLTQKETEQLQG